MYNSQSTCSGVCSFVSGRLLRFFAPQGRHAAPIGVMSGVSNFYVNRNQSLFANEK